MDFERTLTLKRYAAGSWVDGYFQKGALTSSTIQGSVQQLKPNEVMVLPESRRTEESKKLFTEFKLNTSDEKNQLPADVIVVDGKEFEVHSVADWTETDLPHYEVVLVKKNDEGGGDAPR